MHLYDICWLRNTISWLRSQYEVNLTVLSFTSGVGDCDTSVPTCTYECVSRNTMHTVSKEGANSLTKSILMQAEHLLHQKAVLLPWVTA